MPVKTRNAFFLTLIALTFWLAVSGTHAQPDEPPGAGNPPPTVGPAWTEEQKDAQRLAARELRASIEAALAAGEKSIVFPPGNYRFDREQGLLFRGLQDVWFKAEGACFWFGQTHGIRFENCKNVRLTGLTIDSDPLPWVQGVIEKINPESETIVLRMDPGYTLPKGATAEEKRFRMIFFDPETRRELPVKDDWVTEWEPDGERGLKLLKLASSRVFHDPVPGRPVRAGDLLALFTTYGSGANIHLHGCEGMTIESVTNYAASAFAFHETTGKGGNRYLGCKLIRRPATNRLMAARADGFHSSLMEKGPWIEDCEFSHTGDDLLAIHGFFGMVFKILSPREYLVATPFGCPFRAGSKVEFLEATGMGTPRLATIARLEEVSDPAILDEARSLPQTIMDTTKLRIRDMNHVNVTRIVLEADLAAGMFDVVSSGDFCGRGAVVRNNHLHDGHVRGLLAKTEDLLVENNTIERTGQGGIVIKGEFYWLEGPFSKNIRIINNTLVRNGWSVFERIGASHPTLGGIQIGSTFGRRLFLRTPPRGIHNRSIEITGNTIYQPAAFGIAVMNSAEVTIARNTIISPFAAAETASFFDFSGLPDPDGDFSATQLSTLEAPFYAIFLFETYAVSLSENALQQAPSFLRGLTNAGSR